MYITFHIVEKRRKIRVKKFVCILSIKNKLIFGHHFCLKLKYLPVTDLSHSTNPFKSP